MGGVQEEPCPYILVAPHPAGLRPVDPPRQGEGNSAAPLTLDLRGRFLQLPRPETTQDNQLPMHRMIRAAAAAFLACGLAGPAAAIDNPLDRGPLADFLNQFREQAIPREVVSFKTGEKPGTIVVSTRNRRLYYVLGHGQAVRYGVGVGRMGFSWSGTKIVTMKKEWPAWRPPEQMLRRRPDLPRYMAGGQDNPLGARALYLGSSLYRIHGSNEADTIGAAVSSGCIRMTNKDVSDLYDRARIGTKVVVRD